MSKTVSGGHARLEPNPGKRAVAKASANSAARSSASRSGVRSASRTSSAKLPTAKRSSAELEVTRSAKSSALNKAVKSSGALPVIKSDPNLPAISVPKGGLVLAPGCVIKVQAGSMHAITIKHVAALGHFEEVAGILSSPVFDPKDQQQATELIHKLFVPMEVLEQAVRSDPDAVAHAQKKTARLSKAQKKGQRVEDGKWTGNFREIISVCTSSSTVTKESPTFRNVRKFHDAGVLMDRHPQHRAKQGESVYVYLFPKVFREKVAKAIATVFPNKPKDE